MKKNHSAEMLKKLALAAALITLVLTLAACGGGGSVTGSWRLESVSGRAEADVWSFRCGVWKTNLRLITA